MSDVINSSSTDIFTKTLDYSDLPSTKEEKWKYTDIKAFYRKSFINKICLYQNIEIQKYRNIIKSLNLSTENYNVVIISGRIVYNNLSEEEVSAREFTSNFTQEVSLKELPFVMNKLRCVKGLYLKVKKNCILKKPVVISYVHDSDLNYSVFNYKNKFDFDENSKAIVYERFVSLNDSDISSLNIYSECTLRNGAICMFNREKGCNDQNFLLSYKYKIKLFSKSIFSVFHFISNIYFLVYEFVVEMCGPHSYFKANGISLLSKNSHLNYQFDAKHLFSNSESNVNFKSILGDKSSYNFNANAFIDKNISKSKTIQKISNIQLTNNSFVNCKPHLEINSDDVICSHGVTIGQLDKDAVLYLRSRGIPKHQSKKLLIESFACDPILSLISCKDFDMTALSKNYLKRLRHSINSLVG